MNHDPAPGPLDQALRALIDTAEGELPPLPADIDSLLQARVARSVSKGVAATKLALACIAALLIGGAGVVAVLGRTSLPPRADASMPPSAALAAPPPPQAVGSVMVESTIGATVEVPTPERALPLERGTRSRTLAPAVPSESRLVDDARAALRGGDLERAQALLVRHHASFPRGAFVQERDALLALVELRRGSDPRATIDAFAQKHPGSVHNAMLDEAARQPAAARANASTSD